MISIVICSRTSCISEQQRINIESSIGEQYELIVIDNVENKLSIFEAYNIGVSKSIGDILCFMHDDIYFHTPNWGQNVKKYFQQDDTGAIGIAGSPYLPQTTGSWWAGEMVNEQLLINENGKSKMSTKYADGCPDASKPVAVLDGIWLCIRKNLFKKIKFDNENYLGYHFYDIDICMQILQQGFKLFCIYDIKIEHLSAGNVNFQWINNSLKFNLKWQSRLPISVIPLTNSQKLEAEIKTLKEMCRILIANHYSEQYSYKLALKKIWTIYIKNLNYYTSKQLLYFLYHYLSSVFSLKKHERTLR